MPTKIPLSNSIISLNFRSAIASIDTNYVADFEQVLEAYYGNETKIVALNSGTAAIHIALRLAGVKKNDDVLCQSFTFIASVNPILYQGANPIFIESEKDTWNMCPKYLEAAIKDRLSQGKKPKAIIMVHLYGMPAKIHEIQKIAKKYEITLIEDAAEALGASYKDQKCGTFGDFGILSFNENKIITTFGGGALLCTTKKEKEKAIFLATQAREDAPHYQHSEIGYNYRMNAIAASIGSSQMEILAHNIAARSAMHQFYKDIFKKVAGVTVFTTPHKAYFSNHWLSCITIDEHKAPFSKETFRLALLAQNIESRPLWKPMHLQPIFKNSPFFGTNVCENLFKTGLCLPSGSNILPVAKKRIYQTINNLL